MEKLLQDIRFGIRQLLKKPGFAALAIISMALGIGANTSIFSLIDTVLLRPLPVHEPSRLAVLYGTLHKGADVTLQSYPNYKDYRDRNTVMSGLGALPRRHGEPEPGRPQRARLGLSRFRQLPRRARREAVSRAQLFARGRSDAWLASGRHPEPRLVGAALRFRSCDRRQNDALQRQGLHHRRA